MTSRKSNSSNFLNQSFLEDKCPLNELIYLLGKRWMTEVLFSIEEGNARFNSLKHNLRHISDHILADRLRILENQHLILKTSMDKESRAEYRLTELGSELSSLLGNLCDFAEKSLRPISD